MSTAVEPTQWLTVSGAARRLGVSATWVRKLADAGRLHTVVTPYGRLIDPTSIEALQQARKPEVNQ